MPKPIMSKPISKLAKNLEAAARKEPAYPYYNFSKCLEVADAVKRSGGNRALVSKAILAHELGMGAATPIFAQVIASAKTYGMIQGWGSYELTQMAKRYFFPTTETDRRQAELCFFAKPAAFKFLIDRFDGNTLPSASSIANLLLKEANVPESWKDRTAGIFVGGAELLGLIDADRRLRHAVAVEQAVSGNIQEAVVPNVEPVPLITPHHGSTAGGAKVAGTPAAQTGGTASRNVWHFTQGEGTVKVETPNPLSQGLWEKLRGYVELLQPSESTNQGGEP